MIKIVTALSLYVYATTLLAQQRREEGERAGKITEQLDQLKTLQGRDYREKVMEIAKNFDHYLSYQKKVCSGEFSPLVFERREIETEEDGPSEVKKLNKEEHKACFQALLEMQRKYIEISFDKRAEFLQHAHRERMDRLRQQRKAALLRVSSPKKKNRRKSRRKRR